MKLQFREIFFGKLYFLTNLGSLVKKISRKFCGYFKFIQKLMMIMAYLHWSKKFETGSKTLSYLIHCIQQQKNTQEKNRKVFPKHIIILTPQFMDYDKLLYNYFQRRVQRMVNQERQNLEVDLARSLYIIMLNQLEQQIGKTNLPQFIVNFSQFQRWPKRLFKRYIIYDKCGSSFVPELPSQIGKKIETALTKIYDRLSQLGQYGNLLKRKFSTQVQYFCPSLKKSNNIVQYSPSAIDKQLIKIVEYHQKQAVGKFRLPHEFQNNFYLSELEQRIKIFYELKRKRSKTLEQITHLDKEYNFLLGPDFREGYVDRNCLRCTTHFISGTNTNACHPGISFYPVDAYQLNSYDSFSQIQNNVRASMCAMLNQPSGGIVLLGCEREGTSYIPKGLFITQKQKDSLQQKLQGYFTKISPKVKRNQQIFIDFIPMMNLKQNTNKYSQELYILQPLQGIYLCRIFMIPKINYKVFLLKASTEHSSLQARRNNQSKTISQSEHYSFIIQKFQQFYSAGAENSDKYSCTYCHYNVSCKSPAIGKYAYDKIAEEKNLQNDVQIYYQQDPNQRQLQNQSIIQSNPSKKPQQKLKPIDIALRKPQDFKLWTLVVGDKPSIQKLVECANEKQNKGIKIQQMYSQYKFKLTKTTWVMFHDEKFQSMKKLAEKHNITFKNKELKMIASNVYLEIEEGIYGEHYSHLVSWLMQVQSNGKDGIQCGIKDCVSKEVQGKKVWILWFQSLRGSIFAYYFLSDQNYKVRFIRGASHFKNSQVNTPVIMGNSMNMGVGLGMGMGMGMGMNQVGNSQQQNYNNYYGYYQGNYQGGMYPDQTGYSNESSNYQYQNYQQGYGGYPQQGYGNNNNYYPYN